MNLNQMVEETPETDVLDRGSLIARRDEEILERARRAAAEWRDSQIPLAPESRDRTLLMIALLFVLQALPFVLALFVSGCTDGQVSDVTGMIMVLFLITWWTFAEIKST